MNDDLDKIEEELKEKTKTKKEQKISGQSVFKLQEIIKEKSEKQILKSSQKDKKS